jgi:rare lipoprotein A
MKEWLDMKCIRLRQSYGKKHLVVFVSVFFLPLLVCSAQSFKQEGLASWYGEECAGCPTASGEIFNPSQLTAAHRTLPFGTMLTVTNKQNGRKVIVRINDRGPFISGRIIDVSQAAAEQLGMIGQGSAHVIIERAEMEDAALLHNGEIAILDSPRRLLAVSPQKTYFVQIGVYANIRNVTNVLEVLARVGLDAQAVPSEKIINAHCVVISNISGNNLSGIVAKLDSLGFMNIIIKEIQ